MNNQELIKPIVRVGNSAGVVLPKEWVNGKARIQLIEDPLNINADVLQILTSYLYKIKGIYLVGSYARGDECIDSDVDVLVITNNLNKKIEKGKYNLILISEDNVKDALKKNILPLLPMIREAKIILNEDLIKDYKKTFLTKKNLNWHIGTTKSVMKISKIAIELSNEKKEKISDNVMYSLVLRLRELYIVDCLMNKKNSNKNDFLKLIRKITGSIDSYEAYIRSKNNKKSKRFISVESAVKIYDYLIEKIKKQEKWIRKNA